MFGGDSTVVRGGYDWNTPDTNGQYVSFAKFWPVDAWGRWGYELICRRQTTCHDTTQAFAADPAKIDQLEPVTQKATFTIAPGHEALVHLRLNRLGVGQAPDRIQQPRACVPPLEHRQALPRPRPRPERLLVLLSRRPAVQR